MRVSFRLCFILVLVGIMVAAAVACALGGWTDVPEVGLALIIGGAAAIMIRTLLGPTGSPSLTHQRPIGIDTFNEDLILKAEREDMVRTIRSPSGGLFAWWAAGALAILIGVLLRLI